MRWPIRPHIGTALAGKYVGLGPDPAALPGTVSRGLALPLRVERTGPARVERVGPFSVNINRRRPAVLRQDEDGERYGARDHDGHRADRDRKGNFASFKINGMAGV
jgi:hypothetical protein